MFIPVRFRTTIQLPIAELHGVFDEIILSKLQDELEGKCSRFGFIKLDSLKIESRSCGRFIKQHFNGYVHYEVICRSEVCNPAKDSHIEAIVKNKNVMGILAESNIEINDKEVTILDIIVPRRAAGIVSEIDLDTLNIGDKFNVMVMGKSYQLNDSKISIIGRAIKKKNEQNINYIDGEEAGEDAAGESEDEGDAEEDIIGGNSDSESNEDKDSIDSETKEFGGLDLYDDVLGGDDAGEYDNEDDIGDEGDEDDEDGEEDEYDPEDY